MDYSLLLEDDNLDASPSEPLEITLPKNQDGKLFGILDRNTVGEGMGSGIIVWMHSPPNN